MTMSFLNGSNCFGCGRKKKIAFWCYNILIIALFLSLLTSLSLLLSTGPRYPMSVFFGYFKNPLIFLLNYVPVVALFVLFFTFSGQAWLSFALDGFVVLGFTAADYFLLKFRDTPLMLSDILYVREAAEISKEGYDYTPSGLMIACVVGFTVLTFVLSRLCRLKISFGRRYLVLIVAFALSIVVSDVYLDRNVYDKYTRNAESVEGMSPTQNYVSKGFVYPFIHSISDSFNVAPENYDGEKTEWVLSNYQTKMIPEDKKVNIIGIMLEAFCDLETLGVEDIDEKAYNSYRYLKDNGYSGTLVTNIFAAGTIDTERAFLSGITNMKQCGEYTNSYVHYFNENGYHTEGSHPGEEWFYDRVNINKYLGFSKYLFAENHYLEKYGENDMRYDWRVVNDMYEQYINYIENSDQPYFGFHVTYQGHGPYDTDKCGWGTEINPLYTNKNVSSESYNILNNYLGSVQGTCTQLASFYDKIQMLEEPTVVVLFGDHKPWLGDGNSVYDELGIDISLGSKEGFINYYSTEYIIFANDSAKKMLDNEFKGKGPTIGSQFLMNEVFNQLGFAGDDYMQYMEDLRQTIVSCNNVGLIDADGNYYYVSSLPSELQKLYDEYKQVEYYHLNNFKYQ